MLAAEPPRNPEPARPPAAAPRYTRAQDIVELVVLTADPTLLKALRAGAGQSHRLWHVQSPDQVDAMLTAGEVGILLLDVDALGAADHDAEAFIGDLRQRFTELVIVAVGQPHAQAALAKLIGAGAVHRFLTKPVSAERARQGAASAVDRYTQRRRPRLAPPAARGSARRGGLIVGAAALLCVAVGIRWEWSRAAPPPAANRSGAAARPAPSAPSSAAADHEQWLERAQDALLAERLDEAAADVEAARRAGAEPGRIALLQAQLASARTRRRAHAATAGGPPIG